MFYSQFILAKKGPLGTIWIAAHLERKLRKNQVADTDIGVSVDSIIFPDVPIALRLSSHLLLGVVRIYSRKVNYLFDDCSEALLKVKQAFRSTAVDLPPEESTAPYHSITLPETFDLDDFELPDQDTFQGNYVDHHVSNKEQITLQDTMDGVVFSTSQFGLDERFGDGDTSQIGLDPEEDLLLNKLPSPEKVRDEMDIDHVHNTSDDLAESVINENNMRVTEPVKSVEGEPRKQEAAAISQNITVDSAYTESHEYAQAPATPGLVEEPNLSNQKASASDDLFESEKHLPETLTHENPSGMVNHDADSVNAEEKDDIFTGHTIKHSISNLENPDQTTGEACALKTPSDHPCSKTGDLSEKSSSFLSSGHQVDGKGIPYPDTLNCIIESSELVSESVQVLQACSSDIRMNDNLPNSKADASLDLPSESPLTLDKSEDMPGGVTKTRELQPIILSESLQVTDNTAESVNKMNQSADTGLLIQANDSGLSKNRENSVTEHCHPSPMSELPAPEKLLSVPELHAELSPDFLPDITPEKVLTVTDKDGTGVTIGQKRSFTESTHTMDSMHTAESSGKNRLGKTAESIPDDEDLLSSILVGRKPSLLMKLKPTPTQTEVVSMKRPRLASRNITYKRKVLMDDAMVLHGDTIREQLVSTEDIRRVRKKAPCTRQDIWMIQKQYLEEDIVYDPISTGMSMELVCLHNQAYELSGINITKIDDSIVPTEAASCEILPPVDNEAIPNTHDGVTEELNVESQLGTTSLQTEKPLAEGDTCLATSLEQRVISEMEVDGDGVSVVDAADHASSLQVESSSPARVLADNGETTTGCDVLLAGKTNDCSKVYNEASLLDHSSREEDIHSNLVAANDGIGFLFHTDNETLNESSLREGGNGELNEDIELPFTAPEIHGHETLYNNGNILGGPDSIDHDVIMEMLSPINGPNEIPHEFHDSLSQANGTTGADNATVTEDDNGMHYMATEHDTGFLNVDDDDLEVDESYAPSVEETRKRIVDDSGWSSRSRAVGKYLQIMFDKEAEHGKNVIPVGNLLAGKSRKEASRMFFETLVLKTRDYIEVEQTSPFNNINLCPRSKLMKSDF